MSADLEAGPSLLAICAGERALHITEQLALEQGVGKGRAVDLEQWRVGPRRQRVQPVGEHFLADARLTEEQDVHAARGHPTEQLVQAPHGRCLDDESGRFGGGLVVPWPHRVARASEQLLGRAAIVRIDGDADGRGSIARLESRRDLSGHVARFCGARVDHEQLVLGGRVARDHIARANRGQKLGDRVVILFAHADSDHRGVTRQPMRSGHLVLQAGLEVLVRPKLPQALMGGAPADDAHDHAELEELAGRDVDSSARLELLAVEKGAIRAAEVLDLYRAPHMQRGVVARHRGIVELDVGRVSAPDSHRAGARKIDAP